MVVRFGIPLSPVIGLRSDAWRAKRVEEFPGWSFRFGLSVPATLALLEEEWFGAEWMWELEGERKPEFPFAFSSYFGGGGSAFRRAVLNAEMSDGLRRHVESYESVRATILRGLGFLDYVSASPAGVLVAVASIPRQFRVGWEAAGVGLGELGVLADAARAVIGSEGSSEFAGLYENFVKARARFLASPFMRRDDAGALVGSPVAVLAAVGVAVSVLDEDFDGTSSVPVVVL